MIRSMTGYGRGQGRSGVLAVGVDVRSVNHRFLDLKMKLPAEAISLESDLRKRVGRVVDRGRVDLAITLQRENGGATVRINRDLVRDYLKAARALQKETGIAGDIPIDRLLGLPGAVRFDAGRAELTRAESAVLLEAVDRALAALVAMREREGRTLERDLTRRVRVIQARTETIHRRAKGLPRRNAERLRRRVKELAGDVNVDPARLAQEVALLADRTDIEEEVVRLRSHLEAMSQLLNKDSGPRGKELDFLTQELLRETNTIHSKASDLPVTRAALQIKAEVEKIREQVQNVE